MRRPFSAGVVIAVCVAAVCVPGIPASRASSVGSLSTSSSNWVHQLGTPSIDGGRGVSVDSAGNTYITGSTDGTLPGSPDVNAGGSDVFIAKYDVDGNRLWVHQLGTTGRDEGCGLVVDDGGDSCVIGRTDGTLPGSPDVNAGVGDVFIAKYDVDGNRLWVHQLGTTADEYGYGVAHDAAGHCYMTGWTAGTLPGSPELNAGGFSDMFIAKYDLDGNRLWVHQLGTTGFDFGKGVGVDAAGNCYVTGGTEGTLPGSVESRSEPSDAFLAKYNTDGVKLWVHQFGAPGGNAGQAVAADPAGNTYVTGQTQGTLPGSSEQNAGGGDVFLTNYDAQGNRLWVHQFGTPGGDAGFGVGLDDVGNSYVTGIVYGTLPGSPENNAGFMDAFVLKFNSDRVVAVSWSASEASRLNQMAPSLGTNAAGVQKVSTYIISFLLGFSPPTPQPQILPPPGTAVTYTDTWTPDEFSVLDRVTDRFVLNDSDATRFSTQIVDYLLALGGH